MAEPRDTRVLVAGAGTMGRQIAATFVRNGAGEVRVIEPDDERAADARAWIDGFLGDDALASRVRIVPEAGEPDPGVDLALEAVPEVLDIKREVISSLLRAAPSATVASNSSSMPVARFGDAQALHRLVNLHFYVRPWERRVVELMTSGETEAGRMDGLRLLMTSLGFEVFLLSKPSFGLLYNRIWAAIKREVLAIVDEGVADAATVDAICRALDPNPPRGPFERMDTVGLDTIRLIEQAYADERGWPRSRALGDLVDAGHLGRKTGQGFFTYEQDSQGGSL